MPTSPRDEPPPQRIAKLLARAGIASRREVERMIAEGRIAKDGVAFDTPATLLASLDGVTVDGNPVAAAEPTRLFLFHKPPGVLTAERDFSGRPTIYDRLPKDLPRLVPVGRLDFNTEGLLLLTTDGALKRQLELPSTGVERAYRARAYGQVSQQELEGLIEGIEIDGVRYGSINANIERRTGANFWVEMILREGKNREVRRVLEHLGLNTNRLIRTRYGPFILGDLPVGGVGEVRAGDLAAFLQTLGTRAIGGTTLPPISAVPASVGQSRSVRREAKAPAPTRAASPAWPQAQRPAPKKPPTPPRRERKAAVSAPPPPPVEEAPARPARAPQRKPGWARSKIKPGARRSGGKRPGSPRA